MSRMSPRLRLALCAVIIVLSACYAVLVAKSFELAKVVGIGYIAVMLTLLVIINLGARR